MYMRSIAKNQLQGLQWKSRLCYNWFTNYEVRNAVTMEVQQKLFSLMSIVPKDFLNPAVQNGLILQDYKIFISV